MSDDGYDCFISYASPDLALAEALRARLVEAKFEVWFDKARLEAGCDWHRYIEAGCEASRIVLPILTPRWKLSEWTRYETYGHASVIPLIAEGEESAVLPPPLRRWQAQRFNPLTADDAAWQALFAAIRAKLAEPAPDQAPRIVDLPYPANPFFTGRDADLVRIHEELHEAPVAALTQGRVRALVAMGGVGKTTLANEYARRFWRIYPQILWVDARAGLESGFAVLFGKLFPDRASEDLKQEDKARLALAELSAKQDRLLVIDNVEDAESVRPWLPRESLTECRTLITSRYSDWPSEQGIRTITLYVLDPEPSRLFLLTRTKRRAEGVELEACDELAKALGYLPLALEQAAAYITAPGSGIGFVDYLRLYLAATTDLLARKALGSTRLSRRGDCNLAGDRGEAVAGSARDPAPVRLLCRYANSAWVDHGGWCGNIRDCSAIRQRRGACEPRLDGASPPRRVRCSGDLFDDPRLQRYGIPLAWVGADSGAGPVLA